MTVTTIPGPYELPFIGNVADIKDTEVPLNSLHELAEHYGEIYRLRFPGQNPCLFVNNVALTHECCDEKRFRKKIGTLLTNLRKGMRDCIFTCRTDQETWHVAHRILMPAFGPLSIHAMFDEMRDMASQLVLKWARHGAASHIPVAEDFTRLTLDTLALCSMGFRFNSFYQPQLHPYVEAMQEFLVEADSMSRRLPLPGVMFRAKDRRFHENIELMRKVAGEVLMERRNINSSSETSEASRPNDLLAAMLDGVDPQTGRKLTDDLIIDNLIGFLIAGHETTSGMLSFAFYLLLRHPEAYRRAQDEVDSVCGKGAVTLEHMSQLPYLTAVLREALRVHPTIPGFMVEAVEDTTIGTDKYPVKKGQTITCLLGPVHNDPEVWGDDAHEFKPERMFDEPFNKRLEEFPDCWKPFGNGMRACPGRPFAWQESLLICALALQNFTFTAVDPEYELHVTQNITIKPKDFYMRAKLRAGLTATKLEHRLFGVDSASASASVSASTRIDNGVNGVYGVKGGVDRVNGAQEHATPNGTTTAKSKLPITILYGSKSGTCESLARHLATNAPTHGFTPTKVNCLDSLDLTKPLDQPLVIITASYNGKPPPNAVRFVAAIESLAVKSGNEVNEDGKLPLPLSRLGFAVYGCGDSAYAKTFHRVPKLVDATLEKLGAQAIAPLGLIDVAGGRNVLDSFEAWADELLWPALTAKYLSSQLAQGGEGSGIKVMSTLPALVSV